MTSEMTWREAADKWSAGEIVQSVDIGGIGPGYEQAIQILLFEIMNKWNGDFDLQPMNENYPLSY